MALCYSLLFLQINQRSLQAPWYRRIQVSQQIQNNQLSQLPQRKRIKLPLKPNNRPKCKR